MKQYFTGFFTAFCLTASAFLFLGAQNNDLGDVIVRSLKVIDDEGNEVVTLASYKLGGFIWVWNNRGSQAVEMSVDGNSGGYFRANDIEGKSKVEVRAGGNDSRGGLIETYNATGAMTSYLGTGKSGIGILRTFNDSGVETGYFGTSKDRDGMVVLSDQNGQIGWSVDGKQKLMYEP